MKTAEMNQDPNFFRHAASVAARIGVAGLAAAGLFNTIPSATADASPAAVSTQEFDKTAWKIAHELTREVDEGKAIAFDANEQLAWSPEGSKYRFQNDTDVVIEETDHGKRSFYDIVYRKGTRHLKDQTIEDMKVLPISIDMRDYREVTSPYVMRGDNWIVTKRGVIQLQDGTAVTKIYYHNGTSTEAEVGHTKVIDLQGISSF